MAKTLEVSKSIRRQPPLPYGVEQDSDEEQIDIPSRENTSLNAQMIGKSIFDSLNIEDSKKEKKNVLPVEILSDDIFNEEVIEDEPHNGYAINLDELDFEFLASYLIAIYYKKFKYDIFQVSDLISLNPATGILSFPAVYVSDNIYYVEEANITSDLIWNDKRILMSISHYRTDDGRIHFTAYLSSKEKNSKLNLQNVFNFIYNESIIKSKLNKKALWIKRDEHIADAEDLQLSTIVIKDVDPKNMDEIFLPQSTVDEINRFVYYVENYDRYQQSLRYLLYGVPGTAKTLIMKAIASRLKNKATVIISSGDDPRINLTFALATKFSPCVILMDDIDLLISDRRDSLVNPLLSAFLQKLDGIVKNENIFIIATSNDKKLMDIAATRPGRFDAIIDMEKLTKTQYKDLTELSLKQNALDSKYVKIIKKVLIDKFYADNVTGAFVVNFIKQILMIENINKKIDEKIIVSYYKKYQNAFKDSGKTIKEFGFNS